MGEREDELAERVHAEWSKSNEPAFPHLHDSCQRAKHDEHWPGLTIRDYFAGQAVLKAIPNTAIGPDADDIAKYAYQIADAMLRAREADNG